jgi:alpha-glucosidase
VEEVSRSGVPVLRPLFLEFPDATADRHPLDLDTGNEYLFGSDLLVAPPPYPDKLDTYTVKFPPLDWYDYWTGQRLEIQTGDPGDKSADSRDAKPASVNPTLDNLPVYVREGAILPMQALTQSTNEIPQGPLLLRIYPGRDCKGSLYLDDGKSTAYKHGEFLRMQFTCEASADSIKVYIGQHEGSYHPWWSALRVEVYGQKSNATYKLLGGKSDLGTVTLDAAHHMVSVTIPDDGRGSNLEIIAQR